MIDLAPNENRLRRKCRCAIQTCHDPPAESGKIGGSLAGSGWSLALDGTAAEGAPPSLLWQIRGVVGSEEWVCRYLGYPVL